ncbi:MAG: porin [Bacteroidales bacterium]|nr:porin [Bacteroidales bacterium]
MKLIKCIYCVAFLLLFVFSFSVGAQKKGDKKNSLGKETQVVVLDPQEKQYINIINVFVKNSPKMFTAPGAPRFAVIGKKHKYYLGIGGYLKGTASFDFGSPIDNPMYFTTSQIPMNLKPGNGGLFQMGAGTSNIFFNFIGLPKSKHKIGAYVNFNFTGNDYAFNLYWAYLTYAGFKVGYDFTMFAHLAAISPSIDQEGAPSIPTVPNTVFNYTYNKKNWSFALGLEMPMVDPTYDDNTYQVNQRIPAVPAYIQYSWDKGNSSVRLSGLWRNMQYRDVATDKNKNKMGWGVQLSGVVTSTYPLTLYYQGVYGKGIASFIQDLSGLGLDMVPKKNNNDIFDVVPLWGGYLGAQINYTKKLFSSHTYSQVRNYADHYLDGSQEWGDQYKYARYVLNNLFYNVSSNILVGLEYIWGSKTIMDGSTRHDNRIQTMVQFNF